MRKSWSKLRYLVFFIAFAAVTVENPAPGFFSEKFGTSFKEILLNILQLILGFAGLVAVTYIIWGGYMVATARGSAEAAGSGKKTLTNAIIGLLIILMSYVIVRIVTNAVFGHV